MEAGVVGSRVLLTALDCRVDVHDRVCRSYCGLDVNNWLCSDESDAAL